MSLQLELRRVQVHYGSFEALREVSLGLERGQIGCLLGPSGCGKTTALRAIAGFEALSSGEIRIHGKVVSAVGAKTAPELRRVGMVFQDFALFPHLRVDRNVGFGLNGSDRRVRRQRVARLLELVGLAEYARAYPHELSGGQQQRVALARAMAPEPDVLLLDEPFSGLDSDLREQIAGEVRQILKARNITAILVTHDQHEAFVMADHITLLNRGRVAQSATPYELYHHPVDEFVAGFVGQGSIIDVAVGDDGSLPHGLGVLEIDHPARNAGKPLRLLVRPDDIEHARDSAIRLPVIARSFRGAEYLYELELPDGQRVPCMTPSHVEAKVGSTLPVKFNLRHLVLFGA